MGQGETKADKENRERLEDRFMLKTCITRIGELPGLHYEYKEDSRLVGYQYAVAWVFCNNTACERVVNSHDNIEKTLIEIYQENQPKTHRSTCALSIVNKCK